MVAPQIFLIPILNHWIELWINSSPLPRPSCSPSMLSTHPTFYSSFSHSSDFFSLFPRFFFPSQFLSLFFCSFLSLLLHRLIWTFAMKKFLIFQEIVKQLHQLLLAVRYRAIKKLPKATDTTLNKISNQLIWKHNRCRIRSLNEID